MSGVTYALPDGAPCPKCGNPLTGMMISSFCGRCDSRSHAVSVDDHTSRWTHCHIEIRQRNHVAVLCFHTEVIVRYDGTLDREYGGAARRVDGDELLKAELTGTKLKEALTAWNTLCSAARSVGQDIS